MRYAHQQTNMPVSFFSSLITSVLKIIVKGYPLFRPLSTSVDAPYLLQCKVGKDALTCTNNYQIVVSSLSFVSITVEQKVF